jgi:site-specific DNA-methyltransferase (adenine-specific)
MDDLVPKFRNQKIHHSVWNFDIDKNKQGHITPKPLDVLKTIILHCTDPGDVVLDCFGGSGSTAIAARETSRNFILIEKETKYVELINNRINGVVNPKPIKLKKDKAIKMANPNLFEPA